MNPTKPISQVSEKLLLVSKETILDSFPNSIPEEIDHPVQDSILPNRPSAFGSNLLGFQGVRGFLVSRNWR